jgi:hypothetical protein
VLICRKLLQLAATAKRDQHTLGRRDCLLFNNQKITREEWWGNLTEHLNSFLLKSVTGQRKKLRSVLLFA